MKNRFEMNLLSFVVFTIAILIVSAGNRKGARGGAPGARSAGGAGARAGAGAPGARSAGGAGARAGAGAPQGRSLGGAGASGGAGAGARSGARSAGRSGAGAGGRAGRARNENGIGGPENVGPKLEGDNYGIPHYGTDLNQLMRGMQEIQRENGKRVFFKSEPTATGAIETRVIIPDNDFNMPQGLSQVGQTQFIQGPEQTQHQSLPQTMNEVEMNLPDKQYVG